jgi:DNA-binding MarR family transcriptional regulator
MKGDVKQQSSVDAEQVTQLVRYMAELPPQTKSAPPESLVKLMTQLGPILSKNKPRINAHPFSFYLMGSVLYRDTNPTMRELSSALSVPLSTATRMVSLWVDNGWARRLSDPDDRRIVRVALTDSGRRFHDIMEDFLGQHARAILACLTAEERIILLTLLGKVASKWEAKAR